MKTLTIEHLAAYLPYGAKIKMSVFYEDDEVTLIGVTTDEEGDILIQDKESGDWSYCFSPDISLILRPLPQLTEPITHNGETFVPNHHRLFKYFVAADLEDFIGNIENAQYCQIKLLLEWHFDIFNLGADKLCVYMNHDGTLAK